MGASRLVLAGAAIAALTAIGPAKAGDLSPPLYRSGSYVGVSAGYGLGTWSDATAFDGSARGDGWVAGVQAGHNWQFDNGVVGFEGDIQFTGNRSTASTELVGLPVTVLSASGLPTTVQTTDSFSNSWRLPWFGTLRARAGFAADTWLFYGTGGPAVGEVKTSNTTTQVTVTTPTSATQTPLVTSVTSTSDNAIKLGWAIGAGIEHSIASNWTVKLEYLYVDLGAASLVFGSGVATDVRLRDHIARFGINYQFGY